MRGARAYLLDTNVVLHGTREESRVSKAIDAQSCLVIPISHPGVHERWAEMRSALQAEGRQIGENDIWIAATASITGLTVLSTDGDFRHLVRLGLLEAIVLDPKTGLTSP